MEGLGLAPYTATAPPFSAFINDSLKLSSAASWKYPFRQVIITTDESESLIRSSRRSSNPLYNQYLIPAPHGARIGDNKT